MAEADTEVLDELERRLATETAELEALQERTRVLNIEVTGWKGPPNRVLEQWRGRRDGVATFVAFVFGTITTCLTAKLIVLLVNR